MERAAKSHAVEPVPEPNGSEQATRVGGSDRAAQTNGSEQATRVDSSERATQANGSEQATQLNGSEQATRGNGGGPAARTDGHKPALEVTGLHAAYRKNKVLEDVTFTVMPGTLTAIVGPNGAGKSTLLKAMLDLHPRLGGEVRFFGEAYRNAKLRVGYVPQRGSVDWDFPTDALDVVLMGLYGRIGWFKRPGRRHRELALEALGKMGMADFAKRQISELSGGQQQRVFLARALVQDADLYLLDEPLAGVDAATERAIMEMLKTLRAGGKTVMVVHHDLQTVEDDFDQVLMLNRTVIAHGPTASVFTQDTIARAYGGWLRRKELVTE